MRKQCQKLICSFSLILGLLVVALPVTAADQEKDDDYYALMKVFADTFEQIDRNYVKDVDRRELMEAAIEGMITKLDQYSSYISPEDLTQLFRIGLEHPDLHYEIVYGSSDNERSFWDNSNAYRLGYKPTGKSEDWVEQAMAADAELKPDPLADRYQGGGFASAEYSRRDGGA